MQLEDGYYFVLLASDAEGDYQFAKLTNGQWFLVDAGWTEPLPKHERVVVYVRAVRQGDEWGIAK